MKPAAYWVEVIEREALKHGVADSDDLRAALVRIVESVQRDVDTGAAEFMRTLSSRLPEVEPLARAIVEAERNGAGEVPGYEYSEWRDGHCPFCGQDLSLNGVTHTPDCITHEARKVLGG